MSKKYTIISSNYSSNLENSYDSNSDHCIVKTIINIVIFIAIFYLIYKLIFINDNCENFETMQNPSIASLSAAQLASTKTIINNLSSQNAKLTDINDELTQQISDYEKNKYKIINYNKINEESFDKQVDIIYNYFDNYDLPKTDLSSFNLINNQAELTNLINIASNFKNIYKPGDIVNQKSTFNIGKNEICYRNKDKLLDVDNKFMNTYPNCMVCSIDNNKDSMGWMNTQTNIDKVCLFNSNPEPNSGIPNFDNCKTMCNIK
jgi:cell division protein FtsB